jgi:peptidoglycan/xylan/chitin deacetylase (PgdA/CDA1 family)
MYHEILSDDKDIEAWTVVRESEFRRQMEYLNHEFEIISLYDALKLSHQSISRRNHYAVVTFDDGYSGNFHYALPIIESLRIPITIFIATRSVQDQAIHWFDKVICALQKFSPNLEQTDYFLRNTGCRFSPGIRGEERWDLIEGTLRYLKKLSPVERGKAVDSILQQANVVDMYNDYLRPMTIEEVKRAASSSLVTIGAHSHCHNILTQLSKKDLFESINTSKSLLEDWTGKEIGCFTYPNGDYNEDVVSAVKTTGFLCALTTEPCFWQKGQSWYAIPRIGVGRYDSFGEFKAMTSGFIYS